MIRTGWYICDLCRIPTYWNPAGRYCRIPKCWNPAQITRESLCYHVLWSDIKFNYTLHVPTMMYGTRQPTPGFTPDCMVMQKFNMLEFCTYHKSPTAIDVDDTWKLNFQKCYWIFVCILCRKTLFSENMKSREAPSRHFVACTKLSLRTSTYHFFTSKLVIYT